MKLFTSYFANPIKLPETTTLYLAITAYPPEWWDGQVYSKVAPPKELVLYYKNAKRRHSESDEGIEMNYINYYNNNVLRDLIPVNVYTELTEMATKYNKSNIVLLCFEKSSDFCHRHILRSWFQQFGIPCEEVSAETVL